MSSQNTPPSDPARLSAREASSEYGLKRTEEISESIKNIQNTIPKSNGLQIYQPRRTDVIVTTFPKAGTTLLQQISYQVAVFTGGAPRDDPDGTNFSDITERVPWINFMTKMVEDDDKLSSPRLYKTHSPVDRFDLEAQRHIVVLRDPEAFPGSWLDFQFQLYPDALPKKYDNEVVRRHLYDEAVAQLVLGLLPPPTPDESDAFHCTKYDVDANGEPVVTGAWFMHAKGWIDVMHHPNVLLLFYENVTRDYASAATRVAHFMDRTLSPNDLKVVVSRCSREYMAMDGRFQSLWDSRVLGVDAAASKVMGTNRPGFNKLRLCEQHQLELRKQMMRTFNCETYDELRIIVTKESLEDGQQ